MTAAIAVLSVLLGLALVYAVAVTVQYVRLVRSTRIKPRGASAATLAGLSHMFKTAYSLTTIESMARRRVNFLALTMPSRPPIVDSDPGDEDRG